VEQLNKEKVDFQSDVSFDAHSNSNLLFQINNGFCSVIGTMIHLQNLVICLNTFVNYIHATSRHFVTEMIQYRINFFLKQ